MAEDGRMDLEIWHVAGGGLYVAIAALCCAETIIENYGKRRERSGGCWVGLLLCAVWPLLVALFLAQSLYDRLRRRSC